MDSLIDFYPGFAKDFKKSVKKYGTYEYVQDALKDDLQSAVINEEYMDDLGIFSEENSKNMLSSFDDDYNEDEEDDDFDNMQQANKNIKKETVKDLMEKFLFYYQINKRTASSGKLIYEYNVIFFHDKLKSDIEKAFELRLGKYNNLHVMNLEQLYSGINNIRSLKTPYMKLMENFLCDLFANQIDNMDKMISENMIDYKSLWYHFDHPKRIYKCKYLDHDVCFQHDSFEYERNIQSGNNFMMSTYVYIRSKGAVQKVNFEYRIPSFTGKRELSSFDLVPLDDESKVEFESKYERLIQLLDIIGQKKLTGNQYVRKKESMQKVKRDERIIVDNENSRDYGLYPNSIHLSSWESSPTCELEHKVLLFPFVPVFNLGIYKAWGIAHVDDIHDVVYNKAAMEKLVLEQDRKDIILSLIQSDRDERKIDDFIAKKSDNVIFMLHGQPGVGKTLTAEAVSELIEKPLYKISVGDLELNPEDLETSLKDIDGFCTDWNAVLLIDEADIFMEARDLSNITRNAIVSVFLQFLEYNRNIVFLTTNRLSTIDPAIQSRINMIIQYQNLQEADRIKVWKNCLTKWPDLLNNKKLIKSLSKFELNGRQILKIAQTAMSVLVFKGSDVSEKTFLETVEKCYKINMEFNAVTGIVKSSLYC